MTHFHLFFVFANFFSIAVFAFSVACSTASDTESSSVRLIYGGDLFLGRAFNEALYNEKRRSEVFGDTAPLFRNADISLVNGEGVISRGGYLFDKGEPRPFMFRAHPFAADVLKGAGIDIVNVGNNHACDYGRDALLEMLERLRKVGIDYIGGGRDLSDARLPFYFSVRGTVAAVIGADFTNAKLCGALEERPGVLHYELMGGETAEDAAVKDLAAMVKRAKQVSDVVFFSPHWGDNGMDAPTPEIRRLAGKLLRAGFDGILGHSAHKIQGVELIDGKPVIYDAGNFIDDMGGAKGMVWQVEFTSRGVSKLEGYPVQLSRNRTMRAKSKTATEILKTVRKLSAPYRTAVFIDKGIAKIYCRPAGGHRAAKKGGPLFKRPVPDRIKAATTDLVRESIPNDVTPANIAYANGITLVGYKLYTDKLFVPKAAQVVELYFKTDRKLNSDVQVQLDATVRESGSKNSDRHIPGDWMMPVSMWPVGKIIVDRKLFRLKFDPKGTVDFTASLVVDGRLMNPEITSIQENDTSMDNTQERDTADAALPTGPTISMGQASYTADAKRIYDYIRDVRQSRGEPPVE